MLTARDRVVIENAARTLLADFRLSMEEREQETEALVDVLVRATADALGNLEHRRLPARAGEGVR